MPIFTANNQYISESSVEGCEFRSPKRVSGCLILDLDEKVIRYPSEWLTKQSQSQRIARTSAETYARNISYFVEFLNKRPEYQGLTSDEMLLRVTLRVLEDWFIELSDSLDKGTIRGREACLRSFYQYISNGEFRDKVIGRSPFPGQWVSSPPDKKQVVNASLQDLVALMLQTRYERERVLLQFMYDAGVRISEVERVTHRDIQESIRFANTEFVATDESLATIPGYAPLLIKGSKSKGNSIKERHTLITSSTLKRIAAYHASPLYKRYQSRHQHPMDFPAFLNTEGRPYTKASVAKLIERLSSKALKKGKVLRNIHAHLFRHGSAYLVLNDPNLGRDGLERLLNVKKTLGHAFLSTTERYTNIPHDIYSEIVDGSGGLKSKVEKMDYVVEQTKLKIRIGDVK